MDFDLSEFEDEGKLNPLTVDNMPSSGFGETFSLAVQSTLATENTSSERNYFKKSVDAQRSDLASKSPEDKLFLDRFVYNDPAYNMPRKLLNDGSITYNRETNQYSGTSSLARVYINKYKDKLDDVVKYDGLVAKHGMKDRNSLTEESKKKAYDDYMKAEIRLENTKGFIAGVAGFSGAMWGAMHDDINILMLPFGGSAKMVGTGLAAVGKTAAIAAWQEAKLAAVAEVPIQMQAFEWKNDIGIKWEVKDALVSAAASIGMAGLVRAGGSAMIDLSPMAIAKLREKAKVEKDADLDNALDIYEETVAQSPLNNIDDHLEAEAVAHQQVINGEPVRVDDIINESGDLSPLGKSLEPDPKAPTPKKVFESVIPEDKIPLYDTDMKPTVKEVEPKIEIETKTPDKESEVRIDMPDRKPLDDAGVEHAGDNPLEDYKAQEVDEWLSKQEEDVAIPTKVVNEKGEVEITNKSLFEELEQHNKDITTLNKLLECTAV